MSSLAYTHERITYDDGMWADVHRLRMPGDRLVFTDFAATGKPARLVDIARLRLIKAQRRGETGTVVVYECPPRGPVSDLFPGVNPVTADGETLFDAASFTNYTMRQIMLNGWVTLAYDEPTDTFSLSLRRDHISLAMLRNVETLWAWITEADRLYVYAHSPCTRLPVPFDIKHNLAGIGPFDFMSDFVNENHHPLVFNTTFFLLESDDYASHHARLGEAYGLWLRDGEILRPPLYNRAAFVNVDGWQARRMNMRDISIELSDGMRLSPGDDTAFNTHDPGDAGLYTRTYRPPEGAEASGCTPHAPGRVEFTIVDRHITGMKRGGGLMIPQNGFVVSFAEPAIPPATIEQWAHTPTVRYSFRQANGPVSGIQGAALLIQAGEIVVDEHTLAAEDFQPYDREVGGEWHGVVPKYFPFDVDHSRAARIGIGATASGEVVVVAIDGGNGRNRSARDSHGATLLELAQFLREAGAIEAINLDGGGSTQVFFKGGQITRSSDRRTDANILYERMVPSIGFVRASATLGFDQ